MNATPSGIRPKKGGLGLAVLALMAGLLAMGIWLHWSQSREVLALADRQRGFVPEVRVKEIRASGPTLIVKLPGTTSPMEATGIFARASGYVLKRYVDIGSRVKTGDLLAEITAPELDRQVAQAKASQAQAKSNMVLAKLTSERSTKLVVNGYVSQEQADTDRLTYQALQGTLEAQSQQVRVLEQQKAYQKVVAPFDGVITQRNIDNGSLVQADAASGTSMFALSRSNALRIQLYVPQDQAFGLAVGSKATILVPEMPGREFAGQVTRTADALRPDTRTLLVEIDVPNPDGVLSSGVYCTVILELPRRTPSFIVPSEAVIFDRQGLQVAVVQDDAAHIKKINEVRDLGTEIEVDSGVAAGDKVILNPPVNMVDGARVKLAQQQP